MVNYCEALNRFYSYIMASAGTAKVTNKLLGERNMRTQNNDSTIYELRNGKMLKIGTTDRPDRNNFLIVCNYGDWSGYRTLAECEKQIPELESYKMRSGYFHIVERS